MQAFFVLSGAPPFRLMVHQPQFTIWIIHSAVSTSDTLRPPGGGHQLVGRRLLCLSELVEGRRYGVVNRVEVQYIVP